MLNWVQRGGLFMLPLLVCSILGFAAILERTIVVWKHRYDFSSFLKDLLAQLQENVDLRVVRESLERQISIPAQLTIKYLDYLNRTKIIRDEALKREGNHWLGQLGARMRLLSTISHVAPLFGLLGTVAGLVTAFYAIETHAGAVSPSDLAGGIWEALLTTVAGLCVGIPCLLFHQYFEARSEKVADDLEELVSHLDEHFSLYYTAQPSSPNEQLPLENDSEEI